VWPNASRPVSRVLSASLSTCWMTIHLERPLPNASCNQPERRAGNALTPEDAVLPLFGFAPGGVCRAACVAAAAVRSYRTVSPLPKSIRRFVFCGTFPEVTLAGRYPAPFSRGARTFLYRVTATAIIRPTGFYHLGQPPWGCKAP
jgi:hypothetical protein